MTYADMVTKLVKSPYEIMDAINHFKLDLTHATLGIAGEAGEIVDAVKKHVIYEKPLDRENLIEELGDMEFYLEQLRQALGITREQTLEANMKKLEVRYKGFNYSDKQAHERADKQKDSSSVQ
jgi:NTP pyrophosphatase (non-canonical NTP hydrolase)